jgi:hypothetical protein
MGVGIVDKFNPLMVALGESGMESTFCTTWGFLLGTVGSNLH